MKFAASVLATLLFVPGLCSAEPRNVSGIYPSLAMFNDEGECGTGAVVPWADRLWVITYGPHLPLWVERQALRNHAGADANRAP